jgi:PPK2 family polyphosphate:nucleotide phosphotransferase
MPFHAPESPYLVPFDGSFRVGDAPTSPGRPVDRGDEKDRLKDLVDRLSDLQRMLYAHDHHGVLLVFQAMDAAGKDGTIRAVLSGVNPAGCSVVPFKAPSKQELEHDFLWRTARRVPERGKIGVFNRSYYEEVLVVRVHPEFLKAQRLGQHLPGDELWRERFQSIRHHEKHLARNGTLVLKFFLNVSRDEQARRLLARIAEPRKHWKVNPRDVAERTHWDRYMEAYEAALNATSRPWAPWYAIPADNKRYMRATVADIVVRAVESLGAKYPPADPDVVARFAELRTQLESELG